MRTNGHALEKLIAVDPNICHGQPRFSGTRIQVWIILELLEAGVPVREITSKTYYPRLTPKHIQAALHFAAEQVKHREFVAFAKS